MKGQITKHEWRENTWSVDEDSFTCDNCAAHYHVFENGVVSYFVGLQRVMEEPPCIRKTTEDHVQPE